MHLLTPGQLNTYDVLDNDVVVFTEAALETFLAGPIAARDAALARGRGGRHGGEKEAAK